MFVNWECGLARTSRAMPDSRGPACSVFPLPQSLFLRLLRVASGGFLVPRGMEGPGPRFADGAARHGLESSRFADRAQVNMNEDSAQHDECRNIMEHVADGHRPASKGSRTGPENDPRDQVNDAADDNFPELRFLAGVEEAGVRGFEFAFARDNFLDISHPVRVGFRPCHGLQPVHCLECKEDNKAHAKPGMHRTSQWPSAKNGHEPTKQPGKINAESGKQCQKKEERDHPVKKSRVHRVAQQLAKINFG